MPVHQPRFSIVTAVKDAERHLPDFITSIEGQRIQVRDLEVVVVDDGSTDGSLALLNEWSRRSRFSVRVLHQANEGIASARNAGLALATGTWVTFTDADDLLDPGFLAAAARFAKTHPHVRALASRVELLDEATGRPRNRHPRRRMFAQGSRVADLDREPQALAGSAAAMLFRLDWIRSLDLAFDPRIVTPFGSVHFTVRFLLAEEQPRIGILASARYLHRQHAAGGSLRVHSWSQPEAYASTLDHGFLDLIGRAGKEGQPLAAWVQHALLYELAAYLAENDRTATRIQVPKGQAAHFRESLARVLQAFDATVLEGHAVPRYRPAWIDLVLHGYRPSGWHSRSVQRTAVDEAMGLQRLTYRYTGQPPSELLRIDGRSIDPPYAKTMTLLYFDEPRLLERILWVPVDRGLTVELDGIRAPIQTEGRAVRSPGPSGPPRGVMTRFTQLARRTRRAALDLGLHIAARTVYRARFRDAWVLMDRIHNADDNAERLFEYLVRERPDINAWFVLERDTPDWRRMEASGSGRLVEHGSLTWAALMRNARWVLSSHAPVNYPPATLRRIGGRNRKFGFLQHGVLQYDLSRWINTLTMDLFVVSTEAELQSVAGDGTQYRFTHKETRNTGLPRFDRLRRLALETSAEEPTLILVAPTWRSWLTLPLERGSQRRLLHDAFWGSDYVQRWAALLRSPEIAEAIRREGLQLAFMPHPNLQRVLPDFPLEPHVERLAFTDNDIQGIYARTRLLVTDYSSVAFDMASIDRPTVYYQFDRDEVMSGEHVGREGYFIYERDAFGPIVQDADEAVQAVLAAIEEGPELAPHYRARVKRTFPIRDGRACERVVAAIDELSRPWVQRTTR